MQPFLVAGQLWVVQLPESVVVVALLLLLVLGRAWPEGLGFSVAMPLSFLLGLLGHLLF